MYDRSLLINKTSSSERWHSRSSTVPFVCLVFFLIAYYLSPEDFVPVLGQISLYKLISGVAFASLFFDNIKLGKPWLVFPVGIGLLALLCVLMIVNIPFSNWPGGSGEIFTGRIVKLFALAVLIANVVETEKQFRRIMILMTISGALIGFYAINSYMMGEVDRWGRIAGYGSKDFGNPNDMALGLLIIIPFAYQLFARESRLLKRVGYLLALISLVVAILVSMSRMGMLGLVFMASVWVYARWKASALTAVACIVLLVSGVTVATIAFPELVERFESIFDGDKDPNGSRGFRQEHMWDGVTIMIHNPLLGVGIGQSMDSVAQIHNYAKGHWERIHNAYLEVGADMGIPAMVVFISIIVVVLRGLATSGELIGSGSFSQFPISAHLDSTRVSMWTFVLLANFSPASYSWIFFLLIGLASAVVTIAKRTVVDPEMP